MNKTRNFSTLSCLLLLTIGFSSCSVNLGYFFKKVVVDQTIGSVDFGKTLIKFENTNYYLMIRENRTSYCPGGEASLFNNSDTAMSRNISLTKVIDLILNKNIITHFENIKYNPKIDILFISKNKSSRQENIDTLLYYMQKAFNFKVIQEDFKYDLVFVDSLKYSKLLIYKKGNGSLACSKSKISFINKDLYSITDFLNYQYNIFIDYDQSNKNRFSMTIPRNNFNSLKSYLSDKCGIELVRSHPDDKYVRIAFN